MTDDSPNPLRELVSRVYAAGFRDGFTRPDRIEVPAEVLALADDALNWAKASALAEYGAERAARAVAMFEPSTADPVLDAYGPGETR